MEGNLVDIGRDSVGLRQIGRSTDVDAVASAGYPIELSHPVRLARA